MKLAMVQMENAGSMAANLEKSVRAIREAARHGAQLVLFPEVQLTEFFPQYPGLDVAHYAVTADSSEVAALCSACRESGVMAAPNVYLLENGRRYDATLLIGADGTILGAQKMVHIAQAKQFYEQDYYTPADDGFQVFDTPLGRIGIVVCFDRHYPESIRTEALMGAELILVPTVNVKAEPLEMFAWEIRVQAFHSSVAVAMCNRVGKEGAMEFAGESLVADANGELLVMADDREQIVYAEVDLSASARIRAQRPYTTLRRTELYV